MAGACSSGTSDRPLPRILEATASRDVVDGEAQPESTVTVVMDRDFSLASGQSSLASHFELTLPQVDGQRGEQVPVREVHRDPQDPLRFVVRAGFLIPAGTTVAVARKAFRKGERGAIEGQVTSDLTDIQVFLALTQFRFSDTAILQVDPDVAGSDPAATDVAAQRELLRKHMDARGAGDEAAAKAVSRFDSIPAGTIPSPKLRAALSALTGTFAEPAYTHILSSDNCTGRTAALVDFQSPPGAPDLLARSTRDDAGRLLISINPRLSGERLELLMPLLAHEAIHCDDVDGRFEEIAATAFDTLLYTELLVSFPDLATAKTELSRELNVDALAMLNSGRLIPESGGVLPTAGAGPVLPGSTVMAPSFADLIAASYPEVEFNESPTEPLAVAYASNLASAAGMETRDPFNPVYLDELVSRSFTAPMLVALLQALMLEPG